jgi:hypothetical protein
LCTCCCCYGYYISGQISEKVGALKFLWVLGGFAVTMIVALVIQIVDPNSVALLWFPFIPIYVYAIYLRLFIVRKYHIDECSNNPTCNIFGESIWGICCFSCSVCQMARYVYGYEHVLSGDARIGRHDEYIDLEHDYV